MCSPFVIFSSAMILRLLPVLFLSFATPALAPAQAPVAAPSRLERVVSSGAREPALSLPEAVARAIDRNFTLQIQRFATTNAELAIDVAAAEYTPEIAITGRTSVNQSSNASSLLDGVAREGPRQETRRVDASVSQKIATGANIAASTNFGRSETNSSNALLNPAYNSDVSLSIRQPLLRGFGADYNRAAIARARLGLDRANLDFKGAVLDLVRDVEVAYVNLVFAREQLEVRAFSLRIAQQLLDENQARRETGVATDLDVLQAQVGVANAERALVEAEGTVRDREDGLLNLIGQFEFANTVGTVGVPDFTVPDLSFDRSYQLARDQWPAYASQAAALEQLALDVRTARSNRRPTLDAGVAVGYNAREANARDASSNLWDGDGYAWQFDLTLRIPWGFKEEYARLGQAEAALAREEARLRQLEQTILVQVRAAVRSVETNQESVRISGLATGLSARQFELEKARFDAGLSTFRRVQEAQEDLDTARVNELQARGNLRIALAQLARLEASSLDRYRIILE